MYKKNDSVYFIAEAGVNHNGDKQLAYALVDAAADAGADAVKFQTFKADKLASAQVEKAAYQKTNTGNDESQRDMLAKLELPLDWHHELQEHAKKRGIAFLSTAFDNDSLAFLQTLDLAVFKIPSGELTNAPLLWRFAQTGKPLILSTGMATLSEVESALAVICHGLLMKQQPSHMNEVWQLWSKPEARLALQKHVRLLHCTSQYPTPWAEVNLRAMDTLAQAFNLPVGYSDHTEGYLVPIAAVARGACIIEKHFTLDKFLPGPDHQASIEVNELKQLISDIRALELALGNGIKAPQESEWATREIVRQSLIAARHLPAGKTIESADLTTARCGGGLSPEKLWQMIGTINAKTYEAGQVIS